MQSYNNYFLMVIYNSLKIGQSIYSSHSKEQHSLHCLSTHSVPISNWKILHIQWRSPIMWRYFYFPYNKGMLLREIICFSGCIHIPV